MKKILFDFISAQGSINGGAEYTKRILEELRRREGVTLHALFDSSLPFVGEDREKYSPYFVKWVDINKIASIGEYCRNEGIDLFFIGIFQRYLKRNLQGIGCRSVVVIHDILDIECRKRGLFFAFAPKYALKTLFRRSPAADFRNQAHFLLQEGSQVVTVSEYSKRSILKYLPFQRGKDIKVLYSPLRKAAEKRVCPPLQGKKFFLLLRADIPNKNASAAFRAMRIFSKRHPDFYLATTGVSKRKAAWHIPLGRLSAEELEYALGSAAALLYPSFVEGFGYPPVEAMREGTAVISSNTTSLPEVVAGGGLLFSPFSARELLGCMEKVIGEGAPGFSERASARYAVLKARQDKDLEKLIKIICG